MQQIQLYSLVWFRHSAFAFCFPAAWVQAGFIECALCQLHNSFFTGIQNRLIVLEMQALHFQLLCMMSETQQGIITPPSDILMLNFFISPWQELNSFKHFRTGVQIKKWYADMEKFRSVYFCSRNKKVIKYSRNLQTYS